MSDFDKRQKIHDLCQSIPYDNKGCVCPLQDDPDAWCRKYSIPNIPVEELDDIIKKMEEIVHHV